jgi:hypothetical protein
VRFFFDNQISPHLAAALHMLSAPDGHEVTHLRAKFPQSAKDYEWIPALSSEGGWIVVSGDLDIIRTRAERPIWKGAGLIGFFLKRGWINLDSWEQGWRMVKWWPTVISAATAAAPGATFGVGVNPTGKLETL